MEIKYQNEVVVTMRDDLWYNHTILIQIFRVINDRLVELLKENNNGRKKNK